MKKYGLIIILFIIAILLVFIFQKDDSFIKTGNLYISEIVASNSYTYKDSDGEYSDYIELYNDNDYDVNLLNYRLTDSLFEIDKWSFPDITIKDHEYLIIFASGKNKCEDSLACHTNFKLKSDGETISLIDNTGNIINRVSYKELNNDEAYSFTKGKYQVTIPTPGKENSSEVIKKIDVKDYTIRINEYISHNKGSVYASDGSYNDWVELYNYGDNDLSLKGIALSDDVNNLNKYILPDVTIKKKEYLVIYLTGGVNIEGEITANFKLSDNDEKIILSGGNKIIDESKVVKLDKNISYGLKDDKWLYFFSPTPGKENTTYGVEGFDDNGDT